MTELILGAVIPLMVYYFQKGLIEHLYFSSFLLFIFELVLCIEPLWHLYRLTWLLKALVRSWIILSVPELLWLTLWLSGTYCYRQCSLLFKRVSLAGSDLGWWVDLASPSGCFPPSGYGADGSSSMHVRRSLRPVGKGWVSSSSLTWVPLTTKGWRSLSHAFLSYYGWWGSVTGWSLFSHLVIVLYCSFQGQWQLVLFFKSRKMAS